MAPSARWEHFEHIADMGIRGIGPTPAAAFSQAALAMTAVITDPGLVEPRVERTIDCHAEDLEQLFFDFLDSLVFEMSARHLLLSRFDVDIDPSGCHLRAKVWGEPVDRARHAPAVEVKGPTMTALSVRHDPSRQEWIAQCVIDV